MYCLGNHVCHIDTPGKQQPINTVVTPATERPVFIHLSRLSTIGVSSTTVLYYTILYYTILYYRDKSRNLSIKESLVVSLAGMQSNLVDIMTGFKANVNLPQCVIMI